MCFPAKAGIQPRPNNYWTPAFAGEQPKSTPSNEMHDLIIVAVLDLNLPERAARDDFQVAFHRHPQGVEPKVVDQLGNAGSAGHAAVLAIDPDRERTIESH